MVAVCVSLFAFGCGETVTGPGDVTDVFWSLEFLQRADSAVMGPPRTGAFTVRFRDDGRLEVHADCNGCGGDYQLFGAALTVGPLACTRAFCPSAPLDTEFVSLIEAATRVEVTRDTLVLRSAAGLVRFKH